MVREERKRIAKGRCEICGFKGTDLHHVYPGRKNRKISERVETVRWLCHKCHMDLHGQNWEKLQELQVEACEELIKKIGEDATRRLLGKIFIKKSSKLCPRD